MGAPASRAAERWAAAAGATVSVAARRRAATEAAHASEASRARRRARNFPPRVDGRGPRRGGTRPARRGVARRAGPGAVWPGALPRGRAPRRERRSASHERGGGMSEERRAAPGPSTAEASVVEPELARPIVDDVSSIDGEASPVRAAARDSSPAARRRGRMTLRIPDDEVARPQVESAAPPSVRMVSLPPPTPEPAACALTPMRIISIESEPHQAPFVDSDAGPVLVAFDEEWLPQSGSLDDGADVEVVSNIQIDNALSESEPPSAALLEEPTTEPVLPAAPSSPQAIAPADADDEEVRFDDDVPTPALPRVEVAPASDERRSDPGDAPEISPEDMVAVEAAPPVRAALDLPPMRARLPSQPGVELPPIRSHLQPQPIAPPPAKPAPPLRTPLVIVPPHVGNMG